jgi:hypothetical protein
MSTARFPEIAPGPVNSSPVVALLRWVVVSTLLGKGFARIVQEHSSNLLAQMMPLLIFSEVRAWRDVGSLPSSR